MVVRKHHVEVYVRGRARGRIWVEVDIDDDPACQAMVRDLADRYRDDPREVEARFARTGGFRTVRGR